MLHKKTYEAIVFEISDSPACKICVTHRIPEAFGEDALRYLEERLNASRQQGIAGGQFLIDSIEELRKFGACLQQVPKNSGTRAVIALKRDSEPD